MCEVCCHLEDKLLSLLLLLLLLLKILLPFIIIVAASTIATATITLNLYYIISLQSISKLPHEFRNIQNIYNVIKITLRSRVYKNLAFNKIVSRFASLVIV